jgi:proline dehydrogenase
VKLLDRAIVRALPVVPKPIVQLVSDRYIAGAELGDACRVIARENKKGKLATVDVLGESVDTEEEAWAFVDAYSDALAAIDEHDLDANVSIKPTAFGLKLGYDICLENLGRIVREAAERSNFVRVEMEDSSCTDDTIRLYRDLRSAGHDNVGIVLQAYLRRTLDDIRGLADLRPNVRLVKGIYVEPPSVAYKDPDEIRESFSLCLDRLFAGGSYVGVATHDDELIHAATRLADEHGLGFADYEFQMLLGVREDVGDDLVADGHRLRLYVPFGRRWYEYSMRRLQENPKIAGYIASDTIGRFLHLGRNGR